MLILQMRKSKSEKLSVLFKMTQLVQGTAKIQTQVCLTPKPLVFSLYQATSSLDETVTRELGYHLVQDFLGCMLHNTSASERKERPEGFGESWFKQS